jgi:hypothetical protein
MKRKYHRMENSCSGISKFPVDGYQRGKEKVDLFDCDQVTVVKDEA